VKHNTMQLITTVKKKKKKKKGKKRKKKKGVFCPLAQFCRLKLITDYHAFLTFISSITPSINKTKRKGAKGEKSNRTIYIYIDEKIIYIYFHR
jgi:hypothetical protein